MTRSTHPHDGPPALLSAPARSGASILAIIAALASFYFSSQGRGFWGLLAAFVAIGAGLLGGGAGMRAIRTPPSLVPPLEVACE